MYVFTVPLAAMHARQTLQHGNMPQFVEVFSLEAMLVPDFAVGNHGKD